MFDESKTLIVVYKEKDELILNLLRKLVETKDDNAENGDVVGTKDGSVKIVSWTEKVWLEQKKAGTIEDKVLLIGDIKGVDSLFPIIDWKYDKWGIKYGWAGNTAVLYANVSGVSGDDYKLFLEDFRSKALPKDEKPAVGEFLLKTAAFGPFGLIDWFFKNKKKVRQQLYLYGAMNFYIQDLEGFMNA